MDESTARNLGLSFPSPVLSTTFSEYNNAGSTARVISIQPLTRTTPLSLQAQFNFLVQNGTAHVLADPRIATLSGHTATIRAGDTIGILTTVGGGAGTYATSQLQTFQTGVTLDITPLVAPDGNITVALHPVVNSLSGILNGVPQISTRDTETTVRLKDNQTLVIGGLIQENSQNTITKTPVIGDIPVIGGAFNNKQVNGTRNELVISVTPHLVDPSPSDTPSTPAPDQPVEAMSINSLSSEPTPQPVPLTIPPPEHHQHGKQHEPEPSPSPSSLPIVTSPSPSPSPSGSANPTPSPQATTSPGFTYGQAPASTLAAPTDPVRIFALNVNPATISLNGSLDVTATTTSNAETVSLTIGVTPFALTQGAPGQWAGHLALTSSMVPPLTTSLNAQLIATRHDGATASIAVPLTISH